VHQPRGVRHLGVSAGLPAYTKTTMRLRPDRAGTFGFACGMNMIHGTLIVDPADETTRYGGGAKPARLDALDGGGSAAGAEDLEMAERRAEIADLIRRVVISALLTAPVLFAVMAHELFRADWIPALLLNYWMQLGLITPVMFTPAGPSTTSAGWLWRGPRR
jgi:Cu+-exporting ATPase